jgi:hypothetical protein
MPAGAVPRLGQSAQRLATTACVGLLTLAA